MSTFQSFYDYCHSFYGPAQIYGHFFDRNLTKRELTKAIRQRMKHPAFEGDTLDREAVRDLIAASRGMVL